MVSGIMIVIHAAVQWTQAPSVLASTMVLVGLLFCRMVLQSAVLVGHLPAMPSGKAVCLALALLLSFLAVISLGVMALNAPLHVSPSILAHNFGSGIGALYAGLGLAAIRTGLRIILVHCMVAGQLREDTGPAAWYRVRKILMLFASIATSVPIIVAALMQPTHSDTYVILATTWACDVLERAVFIGAYSSPLSATVRTALHLMRARAKSGASTRPAGHGAHTLAGRARAHPSASVVSIAPARAELVSGSVVGPVLAGDAAGDASGKLSPIAVVRGIPAAGALGGVSTGAASPRRVPRRGASQWAGASGRRMSDGMEPPSFPINAVRTVHGLSGIFGSHGFDEMPRPEDVAAWHGLGRRPIVVSAHLSAGLGSVELDPTTKSPGGRTAMSLAGRASVVSDVGTIDPQNSGDVTTFDDGRRRRSAGDPLPGVEGTTEAAVQPLAAKGAAQAGQTPTRGGRRSRTKKEECELTRAMRGTRVHTRAASTGAQTDAGRTSEHDLTASDSVLPGRQAKSPRRRNDPIKVVSMRRHRTRGEDGASNGSSAGQRSSVDEADGDTRACHGSTSSPVIGPGAGPLMAARLPPLAHSGRVPALPASLATDFSPGLRQQLPHAAVGAAALTSLRSLDVPPPLASPEHFRPNTDQKVAPGFESSAQPTSSRHFRRGQNSGQSGGAEAGAPTPSKHDPAHRDLPAPAGILRSASRHRTIDSDTGTTEGPFRHEIVSIGPSAPGFDGRVAQPPAPGTQAHADATIPRGPLASFGASGCSEELSDGTFSANSADADIDRLKAMYRSDSVDACLGMVSSMYFAQAWLSVIPALLVLWVLERSGRVPWLPNEPWVDLVTRAVAVFVFGIVLEIPGLTIVFSVMRLASRIPNGTTFNPPPEAIVAGPSDITLVVAYGLIAMSASVAWAVGGW